MFWNVEGIRRTLADDLNIIPNHQNVVFFVETLSTVQFDIRGFNTVQVYAKKGILGRPYGGIIAAVPEGTEFEVVSSEDSHIHLILPHIDTSFMGFYFKPDTAVEEIVLTICKEVCQPNAGKTQIILGDFNCRVDNGERGQFLCRHLEDFGFFLVNNPKIPTYVTDSGKSVIDLTFSNIPSRLIDHSHRRILSTYAVKKHLQQLSTWALKSRFQVEHPEIKRQRKINPEIFPTNMTEYITRILKTPSGLNSAVAFLLESTLASAPKLQTKIEKHKPWFDLECREMKREILHHLKSGKLSEAMQTAYKNTLISKKKEWYEQQFFKKIEEAMHAPWKLFRKSGLPKIPWQLTTEKIILHYKQLYCKRNDAVESVAFESIAKMQNSLNSPFSETEVAETILGSKNRKATGEDQLANEHLKGSIPYTLQAWTAIFNHCYTYGTLPTRWKDSNTFLLFKGKGDPANPNNYRAISLLSHPFKIYTKLISRRLYSHVDKCLTQEQFGFRIKRSTEGALEKLFTIILPVLDKSKRNGKVYATFVDFQKAFDSVNRTLLLRKIEHRFGIYGNMLNAIRAVLSDNNIYIGNTTCNTKPKITQNIGVLQGDSLSPLLFLLFIDDLVKYIKRENGDLQIDIIMYADDMCLLSKDHLSMQKALDNLANYSRLNSLPVNTLKTVCVKFRKGGRFSINDQFFFDGNPLSYVSSFCYLGITITPRLIMKKHIDNVKTKAYKSIGLMRDLGKISLQIARRIFNMKILPICTYGMKVYGKLLTLENLIELDRIKSRFWKKVLLVPVTTNTSLVHKLVDDVRLMVQLIKGNPEWFDQKTCEVYLKYVHSKNIHLEMGDYQIGPAFASNSWRRSLYPNRYLITGFTVHGFHHLWCTNASFHKLQSECQCKFCSNRNVDRHHPFNCPTINQGENTNLTLREIHNRIVAVIN